MESKDIIALLSDPEKLLRRCYLTISGGRPDIFTRPNGQAPLATFKVTVKNDQTVKGFTTGLSGALGMKKDRPKVVMDILNQDAAIDEKELPPGHFNAYYIPMVQVADAVDNMSSHYTLPTNGDVTVAITSRLSGCVFSLGSDAHGAVLVSHVQPPKAKDPDDTGADLHEREALTKWAGRLHFAGDVNQIRPGLNYDPASGDKVAVVGRRTGDKWQFYMQKAASVNNTNEVRAALKFV